MNKQHIYSPVITWTGNNGAGTAGYTAYGRSHTIAVPGKAVIDASSDVAFRGEQDKYNPEELLVASVSSCHMLWLLHLCADAGVVVTGYEDMPVGMMEETKNGSGRFIEVTLNPVVSVKDRTMADRVAALHEKAHDMCFIANSVNFPVLCKPRTLVQ